MEYCSNTSSSTLPSDTYYLYIVDAGLIIILTTILLIIIMAKRKFREQKEYILLSANLLHELLYGIAWCSGGIFRLSVFLNNTNIPMWTRGSCFQTLHVILFTITFPGSGLMTLVLAIDRLFAVYIPLRYLSFSRNYAFYLSSAGYSIVIPCFIASAMITYGSSDYANFPIAGTCEFSGATYPQVTEIVRGTRAAATMIGLFLYVPITMKLRHVVLANAQYSSLSRGQIKNLIRYNIIVSLMVINEVLLIVVPDLILILWPNNDFRYFLFMLTLTKGLVNVCIIVFTQKDLRIHCFNLIARVICPKKVKKYASQVVIVTNPRTNSVKPSG